MIRRECALDNSTDHLSNPQRPSYEVFVAVKAADQYKLLHCPANRFDWILVNAARVVQQRDMW